jgi:hypothetical protein
MVGSGRPRRSGGGLSPGEEDFLWPWCYSDLVAPDTVNRLSRRLRQTYTGECHRFDVVKSVARGECRTTVDALTFVDGFTSIQFHAVDQNDKDTEMVAFIGPRWTQVDETHTSMVIEQVLATAPNPKSLNPITASGFCLFATKTSEDPYDKPIKIYCEYNTRNSSRIFILDNISDISRHDVR